MVLKFEMLGVKYLRFTRM